MRCASPRSVGLSRQQTSPAKAIPAPTPEKTAPRSTDRPVAVSLPRAHAEANTNTQALPSPASPRRMSHGPNPCTEPMQRVAMPMTTSPALMTVEARKGRVTADRAPSR